MNKHVCVALHFLSKQYYSSDSYFPAHVHYPKTFYLDRTTDSAPSIAKISRHMMLQVSLNESLSQFTDTQ